MATYVPDPTNTAEPLDTRSASTAAAEFRALKSYLTSVVAAGLPPVAGKNGWTLQADTSIPGAKWVNVQSLPAQAGNAGKVPTTDGTNASWVTFYSFLPALAGNGNRLVRVNNSVSAFEYVPFFSQFPAGSPGYLLRLTNGGTDLEWTNSPALGAATAATAAADSNTNQIATTAWVRQAVIGLADSAGVDGLFTIANSTLGSRFQDIRNNLKYIKETQIPGVVSGYAPLSGAAFSGGVSVGLGATDPYGAVGVTRLADGNTYCYFGMTRSGQVAWGLGINSTNVLVFGTGITTGVNSAVSPSATLSPGGIFSAVGVMVSGNAVWHTGNFTPANYAPLGGSGAFGTWGISISGNAATATSAATATTAVSANSATTAGSATTADSAGTLTTARNITVGSQTRSFDGSANINFDLANIGAQPAIGGNGLTSITLTTTTGSPGAGAAGSIVGVY